MALSKEEKEALNDHFQDKDIYNPTKDPAQEPADFAPKCMCGGGCVGMCKGGSIGMAGGGDVPDLGNLWDTGNAGNFEPPQISSDDVIPEQKAPLVENSQKTSIPTQQQPISRSIPAPSMAQKSFSTPAAVSAQPVGSSLAPDQFQELVQTLSRRPTMGQSAMSGLAGLADAIETGVARAPSPGFQKNIEESRQNQRADLINALRAKYETQFKGQELEQAKNRLSEENRHNTATETIGKGESEARLAEAKQAQQQHAIEAMGRLGQGGGMLRQLTGQPAETQAAMNALAQRAGVAGGPKMNNNIPTIATKEQYNALPKGAKFVDSKGNIAVKK